MAKRLFAHFPRLHIRNQRLNPGSPDKAICETEESYKQDVESLQRFLIVEVLPLFRKHLAGARGGPAVRLQAWGESFDPHRMDRLLQLDERLTRQYEKLLGMLERVRRLSARTKS